MLSFSKVSVYTKIEIDYTNAATMQSDEITIWPTWIAKLAHA